MDIDFKVPKLGEGILEVTITRWLKKEGESFEADESLVEIATDKVDSEMTAPAIGVLSKILISEGNSASVGAPIALLSIHKKEEIYVNKETMVDSNVTNTSSINTPNTDGLNPVCSKGHIKQSLTNDNSKISPFKQFSPLVLTIAKKASLTLNDLNNIKIHNKGNRITKKDILNFIFEEKILGNRKSKNKSFLNNSSFLPKYNNNTSISFKNVSNSNQNNITKHNLDHRSTWGKHIPSSLEDISNNKEANFINNPIKIASAENDIILNEKKQGDIKIKLSRNRSVIAKKMSYSNQIIPQVTSFVDIDVTDLINWRNKYKLSFKEKYGESLTYTPIFLWAISKALEEYPIINSYYNNSNNTIIQKKSINIGVAIALENNDLIVPVIKEVNTLRLDQISSKMQDLVYRARLSKLVYEDIIDATYSVSNIGVFDTKMGTPMITPPQVAVLAIGAIRKVLERIDNLNTKNIDSPGHNHNLIWNKCGCSNNNKTHGYIVEKSIITFSHTYDHRVIDGAIGGEFVNKIEKFLCYNNLDNTAKELALTI